LFHRLKMGNMIAKKRDGFSGGQKTKDDSDLSEAAAIARRRWKSV
jgi:hypothetical protein